MSNEDDPLARLISQAGTRQRPSEIMEASVRAIAHEAWQQTLHSERRRRAMWLSAAAVVIAIALTWRLGLSVNSSAPMIAATLVRASSHVTIKDRHEVTRSVTSADSTSNIYVGEEIDTGGGVALLLLDGKANIRLAAHTRLRWQAAGEILLSGGKLYVDSGPHSVPLSIDTSFGTVSHLGTRYQVSRNENDLSVGVRDGIVEIATPQRQMQVQARQLLKVDSRGVVTRQDIESHGAEWEWADNLVPRFEIDNRTVAELLEWVAHETGRMLKYHDADTRVAAMQTILHVRGTSEPLTPMNALSMILPTTDFKIRDVDGQLIVHRQ